MRDDTLGSAFLAAARTDKGMRFIRQAGTVASHPYAILAQQAQSIAGGVCGLGVAPGARIAILLRNGPAFYHGFFGIVFAGAVPVVIPPPPRLGLPTGYCDRTREMLRQADVALVITHGGLQAKISPIAAAVGARCVAVEELGGPPTVVTDALPDDLALVQFSSGSTATPQPVELSHRQILINIDTILALTAPQDGSAPVGVCWLPLHHDMGLIGCFLGSVRAAGDLVLLPPEAFVTDPALWLRCIAEAGATISPAPDFAYRLAADRVPEAALEGLDLSRWAHALNGGERVSAATVERFTRRVTRCGFRPEAMRPVYGMAEATLAVTFSRQGHPPLIRRFRTADMAAGMATADPAGLPLVSVGQPLPGVKLRIMGENGPVGEGRIGGIEIAGPSVAKPGGAMSGDHHRDWLDTGDTGFLCDGQLYIYGRRKDLVIIRGRKFASETIETAVETVTGPGTVCAAIPRHDPDEDIEALAILIERSPEMQLHEEPMAEAVRKRVAEMVGVVVSRIIFVRRGALPRTTSGKVRRGACQGLVAAAQSERQHENGS